MRGLRELVFSTTNRCNARCQDCPIVPSPDPPMQLKSEQMLEIVDQVNSWGSLQLVVFTGGESFLLGSELYTTIANVAEKGLLTRVVTNAYWAKTRQIALQRLTELKELGLTEINISCDDYHQEFVPLQNVKNANDAALEIGLPALIAHRMKPGGQITVEHLSQVLDAELHVFQKEGPNPSNNVVCTGPNIPIRSRTSDLENNREFGEGVGRWKGACPSVMKSIVVFPNLDIQICCGIARSDIPELSLGSLKETPLISLLQRGNEDLVVNWLALEGPESIWGFVRSKNPAIQMPERYVNRCHLCNELFTREEVRRVLHEHAFERSEGLLLMRSALDWITEDWASQAGTVVEI